MGDVRAEADSSATNLIRFCAVHLWGVNSNEHTRNNRARHKPPVRSLPHQWRAGHQEHLYDIGGWPVMNLSTSAAVIAAAGGLGVLVWVLAKVGRALIKI